MKKSKLADEYMRAKAAQDDADKLVESLKKKLLALEADEIEGEHIKVTVVRSAGRTTIDGPLLKQMNPAIYDRVVKVGNPITSLRLVAR